MPSVDAGIHTYLAVSGLRARLHRSGTVVQMRLNHLAAAVFFLTGVVFFLTGNTSMGAVFLALGAVFVALGANAKGDRN